ncbi:MAG: alpha/beta hydrolase [Actinomycetota bacterium]
MGRPTRVAAAGAVLLSLAGCTGGASGPDRAFSPSAATSASGRSQGPAPASSGGPALVQCEERGDLRCGSVDVPLDRANPDGRTISIAFYVHRHTDTGAPAAEPIFATPGGPGSGGLDVMEIALTMDTIVERHDIVAIDPRGTGRSGAIDCPDLQDGWATDHELQVAVAACGEQLGDDADRYGAGDVAMDVEAVRRALGYDRIDYYAFSYGTVPEQAYAARFPEHLHALVFDAGLAVTDPAHMWAWSIGVPGALVREVALMCSRAPACRVRDPAPILRWLVHRVAARPVRGRVERPGGVPLAVRVDEAEVANLLRSTGTCVVCGQVDPAALVNAVASLQRGDPEPLLRLADLHPTGTGGQAPDPSVFSGGDNIAALCNDQDFVWNRTDPIAVRRRKFDAALAGLPKRAYAPFSVRGWIDYARPDGCLAWPAPDRFEPAVPPDAAFPDVPTLILAGDSDTIVPPEVVRTLHDELPHANFVTVAGAAHPVTAPAWGHCATDLVRQLLDTLNVSDASCAGNAASP